MFFGSFQIGCGTKRGAETDARFYRNSRNRDDNPKCSVLTIPLKREIMLNHVF